MTLNRFQSSSFCTDCAVGLPATGLSTSDNFGMKSFQNATRSARRRSPSFIREPSTRYFSVSVVYGGQGMVARAASTGLLSKMLGSLIKKITKQNVTLMLYTGQGKRQGFFYLRVGVGPWVFSGDVVSPK